MGGGGVQDRDEDTGLHNKSRVFGGGRALKTQNPNSGKTLHKQELRQAFKRCHRRRWISQTKWEASYAFMFEHVLWERSCRSCVLVSETAPLHQLQQQP